MATLRRQFLKAVHHKRSMYDSKWFKQGQRISIVQREVDIDDNSIVRKFVTHYTKPTLHYYFTAEEYQHLYPLPVKFINKDHVIEYEAKPEEIDYHIAVLTGKEDFYKESAGPGQKQRRKELHKSRFVHQTDVNLEDHYIDRYLEKMGDKHVSYIPLQQAFGDIEVDGINWEGVPPEHIAPCPINLLGYFFKPTKTLKQFALRNTVLENPLIAEFETNQDRNVWAILQEVNYKGYVGELKRVKKEELMITLEEYVVQAGLSKINKIDTNAPLYKTLRCTKILIEFFDDELSMLKEFLRQINEVDRPDTLAFWNMKFDVLTIINRFKKLGYDPEVAFTAEDFKPWNIADYYEDTKHTEPSERNDTFTTASYTEWVDQMILYATIRKSFGKKESYSYDAILNEEAKEEKLEIDSIKTLPYTDYFKFVLYHALDVVPMSTLEDVIGDISLAYRLSVLTRTRFSKVMKKTVCLRNFANYFYRNNGFLLSNNHNRLNATYGEAKEQFEGAVVLPPSLVEALGLIVGDSRSRRVFGISIDFDAASLYPSILKALNLDSESLLGKIMKKAGGDISVEITSIITRDPETVGHNLGLPSAFEVIISLNLMNEDEKDVFDAS